MARNNDQPIMVMNDEQGTDCAWCLAHRGQDMGNGSHGICEGHAEVEYLRYKINRMFPSVQETAEKEKKRSLFHW